MKKIKNIDKAEGRKYESRYEPDQTGQNWRIGRIS